LSIIHVTNRRLRRMGRGGTQARNHNNCLCSFAFRCEPKTPSKFFTDHPTSKTTLSCELPKLLLVLLHSWIANSRNWQNSCISPSLHFNSSKVLGIWEPSFEPTPLGVQTDRSPGRWHHSYKRMLIPENCLNCSFKFSKLLELLFEILKAAWTVLLNPEICLYCSFKSWNLFELLF